jgi:hypothetical protein
MVYANWPIETVVGFTPQLSTLRIRWKPTRKLVSAVGTAIYNIDLWPNGVPEELVWKPSAGGAGGAKIRKYEYTADISHFISAETCLVKNVWQVYVWIAWKDTDEPVDAIASRYDLMSDESWICGAVPAEFRMWMSLRGGESVAAIPAMIAVPVAVPQIARLPSLAAPNTPRSVSPPAAAARALRSEPLLPKPPRSFSPPAAPRPLRAQLAATETAKRRRIVELAERARFADLSEVERAADTIEALVACGALKYAGGGGADADMQTAETASELVTIAEANRHIVAAQQKAVAIALAHERAAQAAEAYARNVLCQRIYQHLVSGSGEVGECAPTSPELIAAEALKALSA